MQRANQEDAAGGAGTTGGGGTTTAGGTTGAGGVGPGGYSAGAGNLSESEMLNQDLVDLIVEGQAGYGPGFDWGEGATGAVGDASATVGKGAAGAAQDAWGAMRGTSYTSPSGTQYDGTQLEQIANSAMPAGTAVQEWIDYMEGRGKRWGLQSDGHFGWE